MKDMLRTSPVSLNAISYNAVIRALEKINSGVGHEPPIVGDIFIGKYFTSIHG
jgi:hypothetical protein